MPDPKLRKFRKCIDQHLPDGSAHIPDADVAGIKQLVDLAGNPKAAAGLIAEIDRLLSADNPEIDSFLTGGGMGARFDTPEQARSWLRQFRAFFTEKGRASEDEGMVEPDA